MSEEREKIKEPLRRTYRGSEDVRGHVKAIII